MAVLWKHLSKHDKEETERGSYVSLFAAVWLTDQQVSFQLEVTGKSQKPVFPGTIQASAGDYSKDLFKLFGILLTL